MKPISDKRKEQLKEYYALVAQLFLMAGIRSEYSGESPNRLLSDLLECHHIDGRRGARLLDPFNIILCLASEHRYFQAHNTWEMKQKLLAIVKPIRISQGFIEQGFVEQNKTEGA